MYTNELTIRYKTFIKQTMGQALLSVFSQHPDTLLVKTKVGIEFAKDKADYPAVIIKFFERNINNAGIGHFEYLPVFGDPAGSHRKFKHYFYSADIEFAIYALSSLDRDLVADSLVQTISMGDLQDYTNTFFSQIYHQPSSNNVQTDYSSLHFININSDTIQGFGETQTQVPWQEEDGLLYQTSYRVRVSGEFYSLPPSNPLSVISDVKEYPYIGNFEPIPTGDPNTQTPWIPPGIEANALAEQLDTPLAPALTIIPNDGYLGPGFYNYRITATNPFGETLPGPEAQVDAQVTVQGSQISVIWPPVENAVGYNIYGRNRGGEQFITSVTNNAWIDTGYIAANGPLPTTNTSGGLT